MYNAFLILIDMLNQTEAYWHMAASGAHSLQKETQPQILRMKLKLSACISNPRSANE